MRLWGVGMKTVVQIALSAVVCSIPMLLCYFFL